MTIKRINVDMDMHKHIHKLVCKMLLNVMAGIGQKWLTLSWRLHLQPYQKAFAQSALNWQICIKESMEQCSMTAATIENMQIYLADECVKGLIRSIASLMTTHYGQT